MGWNQIKLKDKICFNIIEYWVSKKGHLGAFMHIMLWVTTCLHVIRFHR